MLSYIPVLILFIFAISLGGAFIFLSYFLGRPKKTTTNLNPYECGVEQATLPRIPVNIKFFVVALMFLLFDVEVALLYPWAAYFKSMVSEGMGTFVLVEGLIFIGILLVALVYIFRTGILRWENGK
jgi:NADH-quinone oxidoreductase subunit A